LSVRLTSWMSAAVAVLLALIGTVAVWRGLAWSDTIWLMHVAGRLLEGDRLYRDIIEINPPLIYWVAIPVVMVAKATDTDPIRLYDGAVLALAFASILVTWRLLARLLPYPRQLAVLPLLIFVLITLPGRAVFDEREHLITILLLPWLVLCAVRLTALTDPHYALPLGAGTGIAVALKPYYLLPVALVILWQCRSAGGRKVATWREHWTTMAVLVVYTSVVLLVTPDFLIVVRTYGPMYLALHAQTLWRILAAWQGLLAMVALGVWLSVRYSRGSEAWRVLADGLAFLIAGSLLAVLVQGKGFYYHYLPATAASLMLMGTLAFALVGWGRLMPLVVLGVVAVPIVADRANEAGGHRNPGELRYAILRAELDQRGRPATMIAIYPSGAHDPLRYMYYADVRWASKWPFAWPISAAAHAGRPYRAEAQFAQSMLDDLERAQPDLVLVTREYATGTSRVDAYGYFSRQPRFTRLMDRYVEQPPVAVFRVFPRARPARSSSPAPTNGYQ